MELGRNANNYRLQVDQALESEYLAPSQSSNSNNQLSAELGEPRVKAKACKLMVS